MAVAGGPAGYVHAPIHESLTLSALLSVPGSSVTLGTRLESASNADWEYIRGVVWNDDPAGSLFRDSPGSNHTYALGVEWYPQYKRGAADWNPAQLSGERFYNVVGRSHYGDMQFLHCMASVAGEQPGDTKRKVMTWMEVMYKLSSGEDPQITPGALVEDTKLGDLLDTPPDFPGGSVPPRFQPLSYMLAPGSKFLALDIQKRALGSIFHVIQDSYAVGHTQRVPLNEADQASKGYRDAADMCIKLATLRFTGTSWSGPEGVEEFLDRNVFDLDHNATPANDRVTAFVMAPFVVNGNVIAPENVPSHVPRMASKTNFILVQSRGPLTPAQKEDLARSGAHLLEYLGNYTYLCRYEPHDLQPLRDKHYILNVSIYLRELKSTTALKQAVRTETDKEDYEVDCILHEAPGIVPLELAPQVAKAARVGEDNLEISANKIRLVINQKMLPAPAKLDFVNRIEEVHGDDVSNDMARGALFMAGEGGVDLLSSKYEGNGQIICVADTGIDLGTRGENPPDLTRHPAFKDRVIKIETVWEGDDGFDTHGHGTHVCASICGSGVFQDPKNSDIAIQGTAPASKIVVQSISRPYPSNPTLKSLRIPSDLSDKLFQKAYDAGIRIHSNSWGKPWTDEGGQFDYEDQATQIDRFVYGVPLSKVPPDHVHSGAANQTPASHHEDFVILIAAANNGDKPSDRGRWPSQIGAAAAAKNAITVGACGSNRPNDTFAFVQGVGAKAVTGINDTAVFSSRGPTKAPTNGSGVARGRIKPDVVAPGVAILSAASRALAPGNRSRELNGVSVDNDWIFKSGTSMSTPLVAGCVALLREALEDLYGNKSPSSALIKALLVNGAVNFSGKLGPGFGYDYEQGFGRVIVDSSIAMIRNGTFVDGRGARGGDSCSGSTRFDVPGLVQTGSGSERRYESGDLAIPAGIGRCRLVATLAYPDPAGAALQNSMNLIVISGESFRHGNMGRHGGDGFDNINNVEKVLWDNLPGPTFKVIVEIANNWEPHLPASFAVAWDLREMAKL
ncbi:peptidase S8/S53 domain-containing protein [Microdochium trichocladiopsis]|uniref:Peptidase S8/S53 domain-containing protein n=1 Tax=Microdochium trichocladiopsis TaxID=1682393 RepID=A0A9P9BTY0_9PEZI|nr:peptidase S8/S53 domain-containing protein [Microdochium trichocladiopsis]KAH7036044.1 peptidase S8/S53 domain-containing protein [Microdochium trichocladiopsis]